MKRPTFNIRPAACNFSGTKPPPPQEFFKYNFMNTYFKENPLVAASKNTINKNTIALFMSRILINIWYYISYLLNTNSVQVIQKGLLHRLLIS